MKAEEIAKIIEEKALAEKLNACKTTEDALAVLKEAGADVTLEEVEAFYKVLSGELSDDDLENVAGGVSNAAEAVVSNAAEVVEMIKKKIEDRIKIPSFFKFHR